MLSWYLNVKALIPSHHDQDGIKEGWVFSSVNHFDFQVLNMIPGHYLPVFLFLLAALTFGVLSLVLGRVLAPHHPDVEKNSIYECGFAPFEKVHAKFDVRFYLIAILFILFDVETAFLFPWATSMRELGWQAFATVMVFLAELLVGFIYIWKKGALDWE